MPSGAKNANDWPCRSWGRIKIALYRGCAAVKFGIDGARDIGLARVGGGFDWGTKGRPQATAKVKKADYY